MRFVQVFVSVADMPSPRQIEAVMQNAASCGILGFEVRRVVVYLFVCCFVYSDHVMIIYGVAELLEHRIYMYKCFMGRFSSGHAYSRDTSLPAIPYRQNQCQAIPYTTFPFVPPSEGLAHD